MPFSNFRFFSDASDAYDIPIPGLSRFRHDAPPLNVVDHDHPKVARGAHFSLELSPTLEKTRLE